MPIMNDEKVKVALEAATIQMATRSTLISAIAKALVKKEAIRELVARFMASQAQKEVSEAAQQTITIAPPSTPFSPDGSPPRGNDWMERNPTQFVRRKKKRKSSSSCSENKST